MLRDASYQPEGRHPLVISAFAVHPLPRSPEAIVNGALLDALSLKLQVAVITSSYGYEPLDLNDKRDERLSPTIFADDRNAHPNRILDRLADWLGLPKSHPLGAASRAADRALVLASGAPSLQIQQWAARGASQILTWLDGSFKDAVVWARGTPPHSFQAAIRAYRSRPFPLVVNYNDPMPHCLLFGKSRGNQGRLLEQLQHRQNEFFAAHAQAYTFPSRRLADLMANAAGFDRRRCFVLPHIVPQVRNPADLSVTSAPQTPWVLYAGSAYRNVFSQTLRDGLSRYARSGGRLRFLLVLKQAPTEFLAWIREELPAARIELDAPPERVAQLSAIASGSLVADSRNHAPLLLTKLVESVISGKPFIVLSPPGTTAADVATRCGGLTADPECAAEVEEGLRRFERAVGKKVTSRVSLDGEDSGDRQGQTLDQTKGAGRFSTERIVDDALAVLEYARARFNCHLSGGQEPITPWVEDWP